MTTETVVAISAFVLLVVAFIAGCFAGYSIAWRFARSAELDRRVSDVISRTRAAQAQAKGES